MTEGSKATLLDEDQVIRTLRLGGRPNKYAERRALDRLWRIAQNVRKDLKQPLLKRVKVGVRYLYQADVVDDFIEALSVVQ